MKEIDELIRETLQGENAEWLNEWDEQSLTEMVIDSYHGKSKWLVVLVHSAIVALSVTMLVAGVQLFRVDSTRAMIGWAVTLLGSLIVVVAMKIWYWMELNKKTMTRDIKRFELQLARVSNCLDTNTGSD